MTNDSEDVAVESLKIRLICPDCVGDEFLSDLIEKEGVPGTCHYCSGEGQTFALEKIADLVSTAFAQHYQRTDVNPDGFERAMMSDRDSSYSWERHGEPVVERCGDVGGALADFSDGAHGSILRSMIAAVMPP